MKLPRKPRPNGYVIHEDSARVIVATGFVKKSDNSKTGRMIQIWILAKALDPVSAVKSGHDRVICGSCPLRGIYGSGRTCYVNVGQAPLAVFRAWQRGAYPRLEDVTVFAGRTVRFGAYGDPTHLPFDLARTIADVSAGWTGYTHQWRRPMFQAWRSLVMASVETTQDARIAEAMGWRTFRVTGDADHHSNETLCLSERGVSCEDCLLCSGTSKTAKSIFIPVHGIGKGHYSKAVNR